VTLQRAQRLLAAHELRALLAERDGLLAEVNERRARDGLALAVANAGKPADVEPLFAVEDEVFGTFADGAMGGDHGDEDDLLLDSDAPVAVAKAIPIVATAASKKAGSVALSDDSAVSCLPTTFHPDFASQSFSSDSSSFFGDAYRTDGTSGGAFFGHPAHLFPKLEAMTPPSSDSTQSPLSSSARMFGSGVSVSSPADEAEAADKVSSWAAEQLFAHIQAQQQQQQQQQMASPTAGLPFFHHAQQPTLAGQHHAQNPYTASLLANIAATQQRAAVFGGLGPLFDGNMGADVVSNNGGVDSKKAYSFPMLPSANGADGQQHNAWRSYALAQHGLQQQASGGFHPHHFQQQQPFAGHSHGHNGAGSLSVGDLKEAVRAGMGFGLSLGAHGAPSSAAVGHWAGDVDPFN
jgi:hypothetical protein